MHPSNFVKSTSSVCAQPLPASPLQQPQYKATIPLVFPENPCPNGYLANRYAAESQRGWAMFDEVMAAPPDDFEDFGVQSGVTKRSYQGHEARQPTDLDTVKATCFIDNTSVLDLYSCIHQPGHRVIWDVRLQNTEILERYSQSAFMWYLVVRGIGLIYWPRDFVGIEAARFHLPDGQVVTDRPVPNAHTADIIWNSIEDTHFEPQEGKVRGEIHIAGYRVEAKGNGCQVTFVLRVDLARPLPSYVRSMLMRDFTQAPARLRDAVVNFGAPPYVLDEQKCIVLQRFTWDAETRKTTMRALAQTPGTFMIKLDNVRMYPSGILMPSVTGEGAGCVSIQEAFTGDRIFVHIDGSALMKLWTLSFEARDKDPEPQGQSGWW